MLFALRSRARLAAVLLLAGTVAACASKTKAPPVGTAGADKYLFDRGTELLAKKNWITAREYFRRLVDSYPQSEFKADAKLGIADIEAATGQYDKAIAKYSELASGKDAKLPVEGVLMQLGRAYQEKGSTADAKKTFKRIVDEFPQSPYATAARRELDAIKG